RLTVFVFLTTGFFMIYWGLIRREEIFLKEKFGADFNNFYTSTPRLFPSIKKFSCPEEVIFQTRYLNKAVGDAIWWLAASPVFELIEYFQGTGMIKPLFTLF